MHSRRFGAVMNYNIADIGDPGEGVSEDEDGISLMNSVNEEEQGASQAQPPK